MSGQERSAELWFSQAELDELKADLRGGSVSVGDIEAPLIRLRPSPFDLLVETAFTAEEAQGRRSASGPPQPPREAGAQGGTGQGEGRAPGQGPADDGARQKGQPSGGASRAAGHKEASSASVSGPDPIASSPPPATPGPLRSNPPRRRMMSGEIEVREDLRATQPQLPAMRMDDSPFPSVEISYEEDPGPGRPVREVAALAAAIGVPPEKLDLQGVEDVLSSTPPLTAGPMKVAVAAEAGGSVRHTQASAIEALSRAVQDSPLVSRTAPDLPAVTDAGGDIEETMLDSASSRTPVVSLDESEMDVLSEDEEEPLLRSAGRDADSAATPAVAEEFPDELSGKTPPAPPLIETPASAAPSVSSAGSAAGAAAGAPSVAVPPAVSPPASPISEALTQPLPVVSEDDPIPAPAPPVEQHAPAPTPVPPRRRTPPLGVPLSAWSAEGAAGPSAGPSPQAAVDTDPGIQLPSIEPRRAPRLEHTEPIRTGAGAALRSKRPPEIGTREPFGPNRELGLPPPPSPPAAVVPDPRGAPGREQGTVGPPSGNTPREAPSRTEDEDLALSAQTPGGEVLASLHELITPPKGTSVPPREMAQPGGPREAPSIPPIPREAAYRDSGRRIAGPSGPVSIPPTPPAPQGAQPGQQPSAPPAPPHTPASSPPPPPTTTQAGPPKAGPPLPPAPAAAAVPPMPPHRPAAQTSIPPPPPVPTSAPPPVPTGAPPPVPISAPPPVPTGAPPPPPSSAAPRSSPGIVPPPPPATAPPAPAPPPVPGAAEQAKQQKRRRGKQWFEEIFDEDYLRTLPYLTPRQTERDVNFIVEALEMQPGSRVLDVGCGYGRHAMELASRGHRPVGIDLSLPLLIRAADAARRVQVNVDFVHGDMREMTFDGEFDAAYCFFTTFGYFDDDTNRKVAAGICRALKPGGRFILDLINRDYLIGDLPTRIWWQGDGCVVLEEVDFNYFTSRLQVQRQIILEDGRQLEQEISIRAYSLHEIGKVLHHAGFRVLEVSGSLSLRGRFFGGDSRQLLVLAEKRTEP